MDIEIKRRSIVNNSVAMVGCSTGRTIEGTRTLRDTCGDGGDAINKGPGFKINGAEDNQKTYIVSHRR